MCIEVAVSALCCTGALFCKSCCSLCKSCCSAKFKQMIKLSYVFMTIFFFLITFLISALFTYFKGWFKVGQLDNINILILRMSFSLMILYAFIILCLLLRSNFSKEINEGAWPVKVLIVWGVFFLLILAKKDSFYEGYLLFAQIAGCIYLVY